MAYVADLYRHDLEKRAFAILSSFPEFHRLCEAYNAEFCDKANQLSHLSMGIKLSENQMPEIYGLLPPICKKLGIDIPALYYENSEEINAWTVGSASPYIVVTSELVEKLPAKLIASVLAHECGHIACKHQFHSTIARQLVKEKDKNTFSLIPGIKRNMSRRLISALMFWDRCTELSADRAAVLCDGDIETTVETLIRVHGYGDNINRKEFVKQALDLKQMLDESDDLRSVEMMMTQGESHPRLAARVSECYEWAKSSQCLGILDGTYTEESLAQIEKGNVKTQDVIEAEATFDVSGKEIQSINIDTELERVNKELKRYTNEADKEDYALAVCSGLFAGIIDSLFVGETKITDNDLALSHKQVNHFIEKYAKTRGLEGKNLTQTISHLEDEFKVLQDNVWKGAGIGVSAKNHHLADLAHHPTPLGLVSAIIVRFLRIGSFVNKDGEWHFQLVETHTKDIVEILVPAVISGVLNWLVYLAEKNIEEETEEEIPKGIRIVAHLVASTPMLIEVAKCADNWFGHLVSDMGGSKNTAGGGMGVPGLFISLLHEISVLPGFKDSGLPAFVNDLYVNYKMDLRHEIALGKAIGRQAVPVIFNELFVRLGFFVTHLCEEYKKHNGLKGIEWSSVIPFRNRTVGRMITISSMTFQFADTADAAVHAALACSGDWVLFAGKFVSRFNYLGAGRTAIAIVCEISAEKKQAQLIHEKMILTEAKTVDVIRRVEEYKEKLSEHVANYLAEDIESFLDGFSLMQQGFGSQNSDLVIKGNVVIQKVLGRTPQFTNQQEFDELMDSDIALQL